MTIERRGNAGILDFCDSVHFKDMLFLKAQTGYDPEGIFHGKDNVEEQTRQACKNIKELIRQAGGADSSLCKLNIYVSDSRYCQEVFRVIGEQFSGVSPCCSCIIVDLRRPETLVELDAEASLA